MLGGIWCLPWSRSGSDIGGGGVIVRQQGAKAERVTPGHVTMEQSHTIRAGGMTDATAGLGYLKPFSALSEGFGTARPMRVIEVAES